MRDHGALVKLVLSLVSSSNNKAKKLIPSCLEISVSFRLYKRLNVTVYVSDASNSITTRLALFAAVFDGIENIRLCG